MRGTVVAAVALVLAASGTGVAAERLLTGADVRDGSLRSADVRDGALTRADFAPGRAPRGRRGPVGAPGPPGPQGPQGPSRSPEPQRVVGVTVGADGTTEPPGAILTTHPAQGVYCFMVPGAIWALASSATTEQTAAADVIGPGEERGSCDERATVRAAVSGGDGPFQLLVRLR